MEKIDKILKSCLKRKVKLTESLLVIFLITGSIGYAIENENTNNLAPININISNNMDKTGLEIGTDSRARGIGSITTSRNGIAIGNNAVATGGDETKESIERKLEENKNKLDEIARQEELVRSKTEEVRNKQIRERETIEAGIRVEELKKSKEKARLKWLEAQTNYETEVNNSKNYLKEQEDKIADLNSRLSGLSRISGVDITSEESLNSTATRFKTRVENGTNLNLSLDFYKDYIVNYYKALGDLRENNTKYAKIFPKNFSNNSYVENGNAKNYYFRIERFDEDINSIGIDLSLNSEYNTFTGLSLATYSAVNPILNKNAFTLDKEITKHPNANIIAKNILIDTTTENEYNSVVENAPIFKENFKKYFEHNNNPLLTIDLKEKLSEKFNIRVDYFVKTNEITYYQVKYEETRNVGWLDKKNRALKELKELENKFKNFVYDETAETSIQKSILDILKSRKENWKKENIDKVVERNKVTVGTLTSELETALGVNKNAVLEKQKELEKLKNEVVSKKINYDNINPTEADLILAREYERVKGELNNLSNELKNADDRLKELKNALTLNNLKDLGKDNIAYGTNSLAVKNDAIAFGTSSVTVGEQSISIGKSSSTIGNSSITIGDSGFSKGNEIISIGKSSSTKGNKNILLGNENSIGDANDISNENIIIGSKNTILQGGTGTNRIFGAENKITNGSNNIVIGDGVEIVKVNNAIVIGNGSKAEEGAISVGSIGKERQIKNVKDGTDNQDAVTYKQLKDYVTNNVPNIENLAKKDLTNVNNSTLINKVATGDLDNTNGGLVTDTKIKEKLDLKANKTDLIGKADKDLSNITDKETARTNLNVYSKDEIDNKIGNVTPKTEGDVISDTLKITNGTDRLIGNTDLKIDIENKSITKEKLSTDLMKNIDNKANINGDNIISEKDKEDFRKNINVYNKNEIDSKINNISSQTNLDGEVKENEEKGVKGKVIDKHLKENYVHKSDIANRDRMIISNYNEIQENKKAIENNAREIKRVDAKINKVAALSQATASLDWGDIHTGDIGIGAGVAQYSNEMGIAVGLAYKPTEKVFLSIKWVGLAGEPHYNSIGGSATYRFNFK